MRNQFLFKPANNKARPFYRYIVGENDHMYIAAELGKVAGPYSLQRAQGALEPRLAELVSTGLSSPTTSSSEELT